MCYSIEPRDRIYVKCSGFLFFIKKIGKTLIGKYDQKRLACSKKIQQMH